jgi:glyoxylase-like metal-dependent hydrolase (beta-lactamase superfamily II)
VLTVSLVVMSCATTQQGGGDLVGKAVQSVGGPEALGAVKTVWMRGTVKQWEPEQSQAPGGEMRFACESGFEAVTDVPSGATRIDWNRNFAYPAPRTYAFTEIVTTDAGYVEGIDATARNKQNLESKPPAHSMSSVRLATSQRELRRASPLAMLAMARNPGGVTTTDNVTVGGVSYPAVNYRAGEHAYIVMFDSATGRPARIRTLDYDGVWGDVTYDLVLSDWKAVDGIQVAMTRTYELNGRPVMEVKLTDVKFDVAVSSDRLAIPPAFKETASKPATGGAVPYQWVIRRQFIGTYLDSDNPSFDTKASTGLRFAEIAPGVQHVVGGTHHAMIVEMKDYLIVFDAPVGDAHSNMVLAAAKSKYPAKPVKYLVLSHHHMDHAGGARAYVAQGATLVVGKGTSEYYRRVLAAPFTRNPDVPAKDLKSAAIMEVADRQVFSDGTREVHAYLIQNPHADGFLIGYVPEARLGFVTDIWSPGAGPLPDKLNPNMAALVAGVKKAGIAPARFAGGHGSVADYAPLAALEGK